MSLGRWFLKHPPFMFGTIIATAETFRISQLHFPYIHGYHNKANAFRHALWNILIAKNCMWFTSNLDASLRWTKRITDWHEDFSPNEGLARAMDLHNNGIGRDFYKENKSIKSKELISLLLKELDHSVKISQISDTEGVQHMVYFED